MIGSLTCGLAGGLIAGALIVQAATVQPSTSNALQWAALLVPTIAALAAAAIGIINALKVSAVKIDTEKVAEKAEVLAEKQGDIAEKTKQMEQQGNARWSTLERKFDTALAENVELRAVVAQLMPGATAAGVKRAGEKGLVSPVPHPADDGAGLNQQQKRDVRVEAGGALDDAEAKRKPESPYGKPKDG